MRTLPTIANVPQSIIPGSNAIFDLVVHPDPG